MTKFYSFIKTAILSTIYFYYRISNKANKKVLIKSELGEYKYRNIRVPSRIFTPLTSSKKPMGNLSVMIGIFQEADFQYCLIYDVFVKSIYRRRHIAEKLIISAIKFLRKEKYNSVIAIIRIHNKASIDLFEKMGFEIVKEEDLFSYERKEVLHFKEPVLVARYSITNDEK
ncbi:GNAT family N-acetyltransferase [Carboxylicivirga caseinilyticus]|uniref:GNAT family N-acetyltransferase n=1 Tax=Carboxylicivirga caseinilyticus TaxID=3417572 RepID=UPI003D333EF0|nr:GNAT family N-acetyltransferase [Marinilabiliaceae bacterium A049]